MKHQTATLCDPVGGVTPWLFPCWLLPHIAVLWVITQAAQAQTVTTLANFTGATVKSPLFARLLQGPTEICMARPQRRNTGHGTDLRSPPAETVKPVYSFCAQSNARSGSAPYAGLQCSRMDVFTGLPRLGGLTYAGTVFKITAAGVLTTAQVSTTATAQIPTPPLLQARPETSRNYRVRRRAHFWVRSSR